MENAATTEFDLDEELARLEKERQRSTDSGTTGADEGATREDGQGEKQPSFRDYILDSATFCKTDFPGKRYYLGHIIGEQQIILIPGWRGTGKTWFCLSLGDAMTRGLSFGPWAAGESVPVMYIDGELPPGDLQERIFQLNPRQEREHPLYLYNDCLMSSKGVKRASLLDEVWRHDLKDALIGLGVKVVFFDNISSLTPGIDENAKQAWDPVNQWLLELRFSGITSALPHHTAKNGTQRGTSGREDNVDMSIILKHPPDYTPDRGCDFVVSFSKARVPGKYLSELAEVRFTLGVNAGGFPEWTWANAQSVLKDQIIAMLQDGYKQSEIASICGCDKGYVSRVKTAAIKAGFLKKN